MKLLENEDVLYNLKPHFISQFRYYLFWFFALAVSIFMLTGNEQFVAYLKAKDFSDQPGMNFFSVTYLKSPEFFWLGVLGVFAIIQSIIKIQPKFLILIILVLGACFGSQMWFKEIPNLQFKSLGLFSFVTVLWLEIVRSSTRYMVTNQRIIIQRRGLKDTVRTLFYSKIHDIFLSRTMAGRIFGYGTIIPITASQLGMGSSDSSVAVSGGGTFAGVQGNMETRFGHGQHTVFESHEHTLFCVPDVEQVYNTVIALMNEKN
jgi:hypothetical protein